MSTARPILFSAPMVRALLDGRKTQTRRAVKDTVFMQNCVPHVAVGVHGSRPWKCQYGVPGDLLWVREAAHYGPNRVAYGADNPPLEKGEKVEGWGPRRSGIHMPRWASRCTLKITDVRVERLQDISEEDALAEGCARLVIDDDGKFYESERGTYRTGYAGLWDHINGSGSWDANPWVVALTFDVIKDNVDNVLAQIIEPSTAPAPSGRRAERVSEGANAK